MQDPNFTKELFKAVAEKQRPVAELQKTLRRKKLPDYFQKGRKSSYILHLSVLLFALLHFIYSNYFHVASMDEERMLSLKEQKSAIRVEVLDLPTKVISELRSVDISQKLGSSEKKEAENKVPEDAMHLKKRETLRQELRVEQRKRAAIERLRDQKAEMDLGEREALAGNELSEGYSVSGDIATDRDVHSGKIRNHVLKFWNVPAWMAASKQYRAEIVVKLAPNGSIVSKKLRVGSGNEEFDGYAMKAIEAADPFPQPPESLKRLFLEEGIICAFPE